MDVDGLLELYYEVSGIEGIGIVEFVERAVHGEWGSMHRDVLLTFIDRVEAIVLGNMAVYLEDRPGLDYDPDAVEEENREELDRARAIVLHAFPG